MDDTSVTTEARALVQRIRAGQTDRADLDLAADLLERLTAHDEATVTYTLTRTEAAELTGRATEVLSEFRRVIEQIKKGGSSS